MLCDFEFLGEAALGFQFVGFRASFDLNRVGDFVETHQQERIAIDVFESSGDAAPDGRIATGRSVCGRGRHLGRAVLDSFQFRHRQKLDATARPLTVSSHHVFGDETIRWYGARSADTARNLRQEPPARGRWSVGRTDGKPAFSGLQDRVGNQAKAELIEVKPQALLQVANEHPDAVNAQTAARIAGAAYPWAGLYGG